MRLAFLTALNLSKDPQTKVGSVITSRDGREVSVGYNGFPAGVDESPELWDRPEKYERVVHAEVNALLNAPFTTRGATLYCTLQPCYRCMGQIINAGIDKVIFYDAARPTDPRQDIVQEWASATNLLQMDTDVVCEQLRGMADEKAFLLSKTNIV